MYREHPSTWRENRNKTKSRELSPFWARISSALVKLFASRAMFASSKSRARLFWGVVDLSRTSVLYFHFLLDSRLQKTSAQPVGIEAVFDIALQHLTKSYAMDSFIRTQKCALRCNEYVEFLSRVSIEAAFFFLSVRILNQHSEKRRREHGIDSHEVRSMENKLLRRRGKEL